MKKNNSNNKTAEKKPGLPLLSGKLIALVLVIITLLANVIIVQFESKHNLRLDTTKTKTFSLSDETKEFLLGLEEEIEIIVLGNEQVFTVNDYIGEYGLLIYETLVEMGSVSKNLSVKFVDLIKNPGYVLQYPELSLKQSDILLKSGEKAVSVDPMELLLVSQTQEGAMIVGSSAEQVLLSKILGLISDDGLRVGVIKGFEDLDLTGFSDMLGYNNYAVTELNLLEGQIDRALDVVILAAPESDLTDEQIEKLSEFLENDGAKGKLLLYFASIIQPELPNLEYFLKQWGIGIGEGVVIEENKDKLISADNRAVSIVSLVEGAYTIGMIEEGYKVTVPISAPLEILYENMGNRFTYPIARFDKTTYLADFESTSTDRRGDSVSGPFEAIILTENHGVHEEAEVRSGVMAFGSVDMVGWGYLNTTIVSNKEFFIRFLGEYFERETQIIIGEKVIEYNLLDMTVREIDFLKIVFMGILPLTILILGIVEWRARRRR